MSRGRRGGGGAPAATRLWKPHFGESSKLGLETPDTQHLISSGKGKVLRGLGAGRVGWKAHFQEIPKFDLLGALVHILLWGGRHVGPPVSDDS